MTADNHGTFDIIATIVAEKLSIDKSSITLASTLQELGADSLDIVEIVMKIEEEFSIKIDDEQAEKLHNIQEVVTYVDSVRS